MPHPQDVVDWMFRSREDDRITVAQLPNLPIWIFLAATVLGWALPDPSTAFTVARAVATGALLWWAVDELARGVNPFRRMLGAGALLWVLSGLAGLR
jgi:amino acid permease